MNKSGIEWTDYSWNPITGCLHGCQYCYARRMTARFSGDIRRNKTKTDRYSFDETTGFYNLSEPFKSDTGGILAYPFGFEPTFHEYRLAWPQGIKNGANVFVGAMADMFGAWVPREFLDKIFEACENAPQHNYIFLTKNHDGYSHYGVPTDNHQNFFYGVSITNNSDLHKINSLPIFGNRFLSIEPLLEDLDLDQYKQLFVNWIIIGAETGNRKNKVVPEWEWIKKIVLKADTEGIPVFMKDSLIPIVGEKNMRREFPKQLQQKTVSPKIEAKMNDICGRCRKPAMKKDMVAILARSKRGEGAKHITYLCKECFGIQCDEWGTEVPELEGLKDDVEI